MSADNHGDGDSRDDAGLHRHPPHPDLDDTLTYYQAMEIALRELLIDKGVFTADDVRRQIENMYNRSPAQGARVVAKAWADSEYRKSLLSDGGEACVAAGLDRGLLQARGCREHTRDAQRDRLHAVLLLPTLVVGLV